MKQFAIIFFLFAQLPPIVAQPSPLSESFNAYWNASTPQAKEKAVKAILKLELSFEDVHELLASGKSYRTSVRRGFFSIPQGSTPLPPSCLVFIPHDYSPLKKYPVRFHLHGAVSNMDSKFVFRAVDTLNVSYKTSQTIQVFPAGWALARWWTEPQVDNVNRLLSWVKDNYNMDEQRVSLAGISDGGIGSYFLANCDLTPWSCVTPFIGSLEVLDLLHVRQTYINNLSNKPFFIVNTGRDEIFKKEKQLPYLKLLREENKHLTMFMVDSSGHNMRWMPVLRDSIHSFIKLHKRSSFPDTLVWQTESVEKFNRYHYVVINQIGKTRQQAALNDANTIYQNGTKRNAFKRDSVSALIQVVSSENHVEVKTTNVKKYTLLLSPDQFNFSKPLTITTNGELLQIDKIVPDVKTLFKWNAIDHDRTMLFGKEIEVRVK